MKSTELQFRVRYAETDQMGVVYYGNYAQYFEMGRTEWLRKLGITYRWMEETGIQLPVIDLHVAYKKPARYDDLLTVKTTLLKMPSVRIAFHYEITNEEGLLLTSGSTTLVFIDTKTNKPVMAPDYILEKLKHLTFSS